MNTLSTLCDHFQFGFNFRLYFNAVPLVLNIISFNKYDSIRKIKLWRGSLCCIVANVLKWEIELSFSAQMNIEVKLKS